MKKGFTLIELLAVIVILAIIALIATPIVLDIIEDSKKSSTLRSAEMYLEAVELSIANATLDNNVVTDGTYNILETGDICLKYDSENKCSNILEVEVNGEIPNSGTITISNGVISDVSLDLNNKTIVKNDVEQLEYYVSPCTLISGDKNTNGSKCECEVKENTKYNFYVLSFNEDGTTNLIMDRNICEDGTLATSENTCLTAWVSKTDYNDDTNYGSYGNNNKGPITAMNYLYNSTKDWVNIPNMMVNYIDEGYGYGTIITTGTTTKITNTDGTLETAIYENLKARMPYKSEVSDYSTSTNNGYLYDNLEVVCMAYDDNISDYYDVECDIATEKHGIFEDGLTHINGISGYWTFSSEFTESAIFMIFAGRVTSLGVSNTYYGVRPVITLKL